MLLRTLKGRLARDGADCVLVTEVLDVVKLAGRAYESEQQDRLFNDPLAVAFAGKEAMVRVKELLRQDDVPDPEDVSPGNNTSLF